MWDWIKTHKLITFLVLVIFYLLFIKNQARIIPLRQSSNSYDSGLLMGANKLSTVIPPYQEAAPTADVTNRMVVSESYLSLLVNNVVESQKKIIETTDSFGGYMISSDLQNPQDAATATVAVRIPSNRLNQALEKLRGLAIKVISENLQGNDVTDQFVDNEARLATLAKTKIKFEEILDRATLVQDILNVQREIISLQSQIDSIKGQQKYLEQTAKLARITIYLSTDELALPYAPSESWRPNVIFKQAVRSLIGSLRKLGTIFIWLFVYAVVWLPILLVIFFLKKRKSRV